MIQLLEKLLLKIKHDIITEEWDSLIVNRRKPHTYRVFRQFGEHRVCLHRFDPCGPDDCLAHPHPWPGAFLMLKGEYVHKIGYSDSLGTDPTFVFTEIVRPYSMYEIIHPQTWHSVQPLQTTYTIMINGSPWDAQHAATRTTKGKDLDRMSQEDLATHLKTFANLLDGYFKR